MLLPDLFTGLQDPPQLLYKYWPLLIYKCALACLGRYVLHLGQSNLTNADHKGQFPFFKMGQLCSTHAVHARELQRESKQKLSFS